LTPSPPEQPVSSIKMATAGATSRNSLFILWAQPFLFVAARIEKGWSSERQPFPSHPIAK
jgi:hypothetical protein